MRKVKRRTEQKYRNTSVIVGGQRFASKKEAARAVELRMLERTGKISDLQMQVRFTLIPAQYEDVETVDKRSGKVSMKRKCVERACEYIADFVYKDQNGKQVIEDTKGFRTPEYVIKRKLMRFLLGLEIKEI